MSGLPEGLSHGESDKWYEVPRWAGFFAEVGSRASKLIRGNGRLVVGLAVPTRAYCAAFTAIGALTALLANESGLGDLKAHFDGLSRLPFGTPLWIRQKKRRIYGEFQGTDKSSTDGPRLRILISHNKRTDEKTLLLLPQSKAFDVGVRGSRGGGVPKIQKGKELIDNEAFVRMFFQGADVSPSFMKSQLWCLLVGHAGALRSEIGETEFAFATSGQGAIRGCLQEVLRVRSLVFNTGTFFSDVLGEVQGTETSPVVIFDGARAFLHWRHRFERSDWIVILDRTEPDFPTATDVVNQLFVNRVEDHSIEDALGDLPDSPAAVEILAFREHQR